jgi:hypothetical protein
VIDDLKSYVRPDPCAPDNQDLADLFFLSERGRCYTEHDGRPSDSLSRVFRQLEADAGVAHRQGRNFKGLRTTFFNAAPRGGYELERKIIMGRAQGTIDLDSYLEDVGMDRLRHVVTHVFDQFAPAIETALSNAPADATARRGGKRAEAAPLAVAAPARRGSPGEAVPD